MSNIFGARKLKDLNMIVEIGLGHIDWWRRTLVLMIIH
jgi:hypothetical protein